MRKFSSNPNVDNSDLTAYPDARIKNNTGSDDGTAVNERVYGDVIQFFLKLKRLAGIIENDLPDNEVNGFQTIDALINLASKNDYLQTVGSVSGVLNVGVKIGLMQVNETLICKASSDLTTETAIKGIDNVIIAISSSSNFKANDYLLLQKTASNIQITRLVDAVNLDVVVSELNFLKKATQTQENAGTSEAVATTPKTNKTVFERRVNGVDSATYLASSLQNGLYPSAHFDIVAGLGTSPIKNKGYFAGLNIGGTVGSLTVGGDATSANSETVVESGTSTILVTMANAMANTNYIVKLYPQSDGNIYDDLDNYGILFKPISTTQFRVGLSKIGSQTTSIRVHFEVEQL